MTEKVSPFRIAGLCGLVALGAIAYVYLHDRGWWLLAIAVVIGLAAVWLYAPAWVAKKLAEWRTDLKMLGLWISNAFAKDRNKHRAATMAHQQAMLDGRMLNPVNIFTIVPVVVGLFGATWGMVSNWRYEKAVERLSHARDAPCSDRELSKDDHGYFRTTRAACSTLGATAEAARDYQKMAAGLAVQRDAAIRQANAENAAEVARLRRREQSRLATAAQQRRRENEAFNAALGDSAPPDLERSLCELAGDPACGSPSAPAPAAAGSPAGVVSEPPRDAPLSLLPRTADAS